jgi:hypothetical protein
VTAHTTSRVTISDFKAGIFSDYHASSTAPPAGQSTFDPAINGAAVVADTWGCCADRSGALVPLPRVVTGKTEAFAPTPNRGNPLANTYLLDAILVDQMQVDGSVESATPEVVMMQSFNWFATAFTRVRRHQQWLSGAPAGDVALMKSIVAGSTPNLPSGNLTPFRGAVDETNITNPLAIRKGFVFVVRPTRDGTSPNTGPNFVTGVMSTEDRAITDFDDRHALDGVAPGSKLWPERCKQSIFGYYPNFDAPVGLAPTATGFLDNEANENFRGGFLCVGHQGRIVVAQRLPSQYPGVGTAVGWTFKDRLSATGLLDITTPAVSGEFVEENTSGIGLIASLSADELLVVKHTGGGYLLRGSIASPTVTKLPFLESTYGVVASPAMTPIGLVYGTRNGVFVWDGGETSQHISPQLDGFFWNHAPGLAYDGHRGRFNFWHPWVMAPNGFMFDTRHNGWWRLDDPSTHDAYSVYATSENNRLYAFPFQHSAARPTLWNEASPDVFASSWSWRSQPLVETRDIAFKLRDFTILATATDVGSTITVTVSGFDADGVEVTIPPETITLGDALDRPQMVNRDLTGQTSALSYMQVRIQGGNTGGLSAPKLHSISFGVVDTNPVPGR